MGKIKLPRRRKKAYIKARGHHNYKVLVNILLPEEGHSNFYKDMEMLTGPDGNPDFRGVGRW